ncbi:MAG: hypothetical protein Q8L13_18780 [Bradyrhizobium sp.]|uniref:hypothetical protein n=1 Tax=Bradyrhizobium sp. TaxID=376 RepID=UPI0027307ACD|nr:hypothetical protein [Bradyrhizobium sp.]MDP1868367.1 hypothetical protein [Bradyrhizobium sp.]
MDFARRQLNRRVEIVRRGLSAQFRLGNIPNRSVRARAVDAENFAPVVVETDDAKLGIGRFGFKHARKTGCKPCPPCRFGNAIGPIDTACHARANQSVQRSGVSITGDIATYSGDVGFQVSCDQPRMRLHTIKDAWNDRLFKAAMAQPSDRGYRERNQQDHRDG